MEKSCTYLKISKSDDKEGKIIRNFYQSFFFFLNIGIRLGVSISSIFHPMKQIKVHRLLFSLFKDASPLTSLKIIIRLLGKVCSPPSYNLPSYPPALSWQLHLHFPSPCYLSSADPFRLGRGVAKNCLKDFSENGARKIPLCPRASETISYLN